VSWRVRPTEDTSRHDRLVELKRFAEAVRRLGDHSEVVHLVLGQVGDTEGGHVRRTDADLCPVTTTRFPFLNDVPFDRVATVVERR